MAGGQRQIILPGAPPIAVRLRRHGRARRLSLRVSGLDGAVTLSAPPWAAEDELADFVRSREGWIRQQLARQPEPVPVRLGAALPVEGVMHRVGPGGGRAARIEAGEIRVPAAAGRPGARVAALLRLLARERLATACARHAAVLGVAPAAISLRDPRSRWGSCSASGRLMFSWRLAMAPPGVLDYVAAHEVAHLRRMDHSPAFWALVERLLPGYRSPRDWLRREGAGLHRYRFAD